jgi:hypothetical protein
VSDAAIHRNRRQFVEPGVTWYTSAGAINSSGLFTAPKVSAATAATVSAVSVADHSKWINANVTVQPGASVAISISPTSAALASGAQKQFAATISNTSNPPGSVVASSGLITATGLYTAPAVSSATAATVTATSQADTTKKAVSAVQISAPAHHSVLLS